MPHSRAPERWRRAAARLPTVGQANGLCDEALNVASGDKKYIDGACVLTDSDGDKVFSTFDTRDVDKSQPDMACGTHIITGGTGKYAGITGKEPFKCINLPALAGSGGYTAMDIPHNTTWEIVTGH
jgi:hypothetical protein